MTSPINRQNLDFIESLFLQYKNNPQSVSQDWKLFFDGVMWGGAEGSFSRGELNVYNLINAYREDGHMKATLNPLQDHKTEENFLALSQFHLKEQDRQKKFEVFSFLHKDFQNLDELLTFLEKTYCSSLALHAGGCSPKIRSWFFKKFEQESFQLSTMQKKQILTKLIHTEAFEKFLHHRFVGAKRFSIEGSDALIPMLEFLADQAVEGGAEELVVGMSHRGRLSVMTHFMNQPVEVIFSFFEGKAFSDVEFTGDVKYHNGYSCEKKTFSQKKCHVLLGFNPSHLESIAPVICGVTRARQRMLGDTGERKKVIPVLIHGDASFCGQGVVSETLQLSRLKGYTTGGSIHIIVNNQIGFTTTPLEGRSSPYASDLAQSIQAPILLVNGDHVESCMRAIHLAVAFRKEFQQDIVIDLISYRRYGHNEGDEPAFTQPLMYDKIKKHPTVMTLYQKKLAEEGMAQDGLEFKNYTDELQKALDRVRQSPMSLKEGDLRGSLWPYIPKPSLEEIEEPCHTSSQHLDFVLKKLTEVPEGVNVHPKVRRLIQQRQKVVEAGQLDWALAELCAYGTLCLENHPVRLSGQDCKRGTFSHRHAVYFDVQNGKEYTPLAQLKPDQKEFCIYNSPLSEMAVLAFEYGNSCSDHSSLIVWEAQFGDFANGAQIIIDQYISSGEEKWLQSCSLTLLLPHGYEGQGPEHSSARLERFLQLCAQYNIQVCCPSTPAQLFHVFRRQVKRKVFKPLILITPKSLLRHPKMISKKEDFDKSFQEIIADEPAQLQNVQVIILCTGKIYFDLMEKQSQIGSHTLVIRLEQLYPFPKNSLSPYLNGLPGLRKIICLQEEPQNMGAYGFISARICELLEDLGQKNISVEYCGRIAQASPAEGSLKDHQKEQARIILEALSKTRIKT